jgi:hypothetical protein
MKPLEAEIVPPLSRDPSRAARSARNWGESVRPRAKSIGLEARRSTETSEGSTFHGQRSEPIDPRLRPFIEAMADAIWADILRKSNVPKCEP